MSTQPNQPRSVNGGEDLNGNDNSGEASQPRRMIAPTPPITPFSGGQGGSPPTKKQLKTMTSIEQAKDRAQVTAATSMSIVHVALLKQVLDTGPAENPYYEMTMGFIIAALILQVIAGFISLYIALLRYYFTEYKDDFVDDFMKTCCPFSCRRRTTTRDPSNIYDWIDTGPPVRSASSLINEEESDENNKCCNFEFTITRFADYEYQILSYYDKMIEENIKADLVTVNYDLEIEWLSKIIKSLKTDYETYKALDAEDTQANQEKLKSISDQIEEAHKKQRSIEEKMKNAKKTKAQEKVLEKYVERIQEERVLKRSTFWQNWLNIMMYTVFVLNALIAGFGLAAPSNAVPAVNVIVPNATLAFPNA